MTPDPNSLSHTDRAVLVAIMRHGPRVGAARLAEEAGLLTEYAVYQAIGRLAEAGWLAKSGERQTRRLTVLAAPPALTDAERAAAAVPAAQTRRCLSCRRHFKSRGPHNKVCGGCKDLESWQAGSDLTEYGVGYRSGRV